jgi:site-specific DNA-methyltransferase (adenine-specific)/adenine-specific DNA-methyltransferase
MPNLTEEQRQHILALLENGLDLPAEYKPLLFPPERQEYELVYAGKEREEDILAETMAVPLQPIRSFGVNGVEWHNHLIFGDNLQAMKTLLRMKERGELVNSDGMPGVRLVYIDPPFATKQEFQGGQEERAYQDKVVGAQFLEFLRKRLVLIHELLSEDGFLLIHLDYRYVSHIRVLLDEIFGRGNFRNEIIVRRSTKSVQSQFEQINALAVANYTLLLYSKSGTTRVRKLSSPLNSTAKGKWDTYWRSPDRPTMRYEIFGITPDKGQWRWMKERGYRAKANYEKFLQEGHSDEEIDDYFVSHYEGTGQKLDFVRLGPSGSVQYYVPPRVVKISNNVWMDMPSSSISTGYPTEKSELLLHRIISWLSDGGDLVLDAFAGSGTTLAVAEKLRRRWIGIDCGKLAIYTIQKRLLNLKSEIGNKGKALKPKPFTLYNAGLYEFARLRDLPWESWRTYALSLFQCQDEPHKVAGIELDGTRGGDDVLVFNHRLGGGAVLDYGFIEELHTQLRSRASTRFFIIAPAASVAFLEDYIEKGRSRYYILRIPYSIINELHTRDFSALVQPVDETEVNATVEAVGFDFIRQPKVACEYSIVQPKGELFKKAVVKINTFISQALAKGASLKGNLETLSMVLVDYDYPHNPARKGKETPPAFEVDAVFYASDIQAASWEVCMPVESLGKCVMLVYVDIYGNEYTEVKTKEDFGSNHA